MKKNNFPSGELLFRRENQQYKDLAEKVIPDILVEDDCASIGGRSEMTVTHVTPEAGRKTKSIPVKEFGGIDHFPDKIDDLIRL